MKIQIVGIVINGVFINYQRILLPKGNADPKLFSMPALVPPNAYPSAPTSALLTCISILSTYSHR